MSQTDLLRSTVALLDAARIPYMIVGSYAEDTMLAKLEWGAASGSERQMDDVVAIARTQSVDRDYLERWAAELGVSSQLATALKRM